MKKPAAMIALALLLVAGLVLFSRRASAAPASDPLPGTPAGAPSDVIGGAVGNLTPGVPGALPAGIAPIAFEGGYTPGGPLAQPTKSAPPAQAAPLQEIPAPRAGGGRPNISYGVEQTHAF